MLETVSKSFYSLIVFLIILHKEKLSTKSYGGDTDSTIVDYSSIFSESPFFRNRNALVAFNMGTCSAHLRMQVAEHRISN